MRQYRGFDFEYRGKVILGAERLEEIYAAIERGIDRLLDDDGVVIVTWAEMSSRDVPVEYLERVEIRRSVDPSLDDPDGRRSSNLADEVLGDL